MQVLKIDVNAIVKLILKKWKEVIKTSSIQTSEDYYCSEKLIRSKWLIMIFKDKAIHHSKIKSKDIFNVLVDAEGVKNILGR